RGTSPGRIPQATVCSSPSRIKARTSSSEQPSSAATSRTVRGAGHSTSGVRVAFARLDAEDRDRRTHPRGVHEPRPIRVGCPGPDRRDCLMVSAMSDPTADHLTATQRAALETELAELEGPRRRAVVQAIKTAREHGDLSENFEYHAAKNEQGLLEARIRTLRHRLDNAVIVDESALEAGEVGSGSVVAI